MRPHLELVIVREGTAEVVAEGQSIQLQSGHAALVYSRTYLQYEFRDRTDTTVLWCEVSSPSSTDLLTNTLSGLPIAVPVSNRMLDLQQMGIEVALMDTLTAVPLRAALGRALFQEFIFQAETANSEHSIHRSVLRAKGFIEDHLAVPCSLNEVAKFANVTPQYLTRLFRRDLNVTPIQYLWRQRAKKANQLLQRTSLSVSEIAFACGYDNPNHFSRHIKEQFGAPPTELRRRRLEK
ncbi:MAG: helix-turn-helix domain-containing protein [Alphaproteobacteria bacterium]|nr:helix-turn-helix domain-containing protein [Alphaproteobacteria bacterium]MBT4084922.1 helix-turn-helix domain-containing protein [Alphaproteobacteria bacterium]MBT4542299.1 helix-turn-helix domain-containing protein [Alphaproteobacteria bacterium]